MPQGEFEMKNNALEELSDKVRMGIPIGFWEAVAVVEYQAWLKEQKAITRRFTLSAKAERLWNNLKLWFRFCAK